MYWNLSCVVGWRVPRCGFNIYSGSTTILTTLEETQFLTTKKYLIHVYYLTKLIEGFGEYIN